LTDLSAYENSPFGFMLRFVRRHSLAHAFIVGAVSLAVFCSVFTQYAVKFLVDALTDQVAAERVWIGFTFLVAMIASDNLLWRVASWTGNATFVTVSGEVRHDLFQHLTGHSSAYFAARPPGSLTSRVTATSNAFFAVENSVVWNVLPPFLASFYAMALVATVSWKLSLVLCVIAGGIMVLMFRKAIAGKHLHTRFASRAAAVDGEMNDIVGNMVAIRSFGGLFREHRRFKSLIDHEMSARKESLRYLERLRIQHALITILLTVLVLAWAINLRLQGAATTGDVILVCTLGLTILHATRDMAVALVDVTQHLARFSEALSTLLVAHQLADRPGATALVRRGSTIKFERVRFAYPDNPVLFKALDFEIKTGQRVGLVGSSGSGKSTIFALIQRFYDVQGGRVLIDGQDVSDVTQQSLQEAVAIVPQSPSLFHRSLLENIRYARPEATTSEVWEAAQAAHCCDFINELPQGLDTIVGDRGALLSGGQRQRVAIARAFLKRAPLLLLDEATSALDGPSEALIREALDRLMRGSTVIAIAHRLSTVRNFDRILVMERGRIVQDDAPDCLMRVDGRFRELVDGDLQRTLVRTPAEANMRADRHASRQITAGLEN
jgi:ATP-binding cassette subfamily B protein